MTERTARTHNHVSNRTKNKTGGERKIVFKGVLDSPFRIQWPIVPPSVQKDVLTATISQLYGISEYQATRKRKRTSAQHPRKKKREDEHEAGADTSKGAFSEASIEDSIPQKEVSIAPERPPILDHLVIGINEVTKRLEQQVQTRRASLITTNPSKDGPGPPPPSPLRFILVCRADINPPILVDHLPHLVAAFNSLRPDVPVILAPLQKGAERLLSQAVGLRRAAVLGFDTNCLNLGTLVGLLSTVPAPAATWLVSSAIVDKFVPTHIKQVRSTAPKDMKAEKQRRKEEKVTKKAKRRCMNKNIECSVLPSRTR